MLNNREELSFPAMIMSIKQQLSYDFEDYKKHFIKPEIQALGYLSFAFFVAAEADKEIEFVTQN